MTLQGLKKTVIAGIASTAMAIALMMGFGSATAHADVLDDLAQEFSLGAGAGQVSKLVKQSLLLRQQGFRPSKANYEAIDKALTYRPNQTPLVKALQDTVGDQRTLRQIALAAAEQQQRQQQQLQELQAQMGGDESPPGPTIGLPIAPTG